MYIPPSESPSASRACSSNASYASFWEYVGCGSNCVHGVSRSPGFQYSEFFFFNFLRLVPFMVAIITPTCMRSTICLPILRDFSLCSFSSLPVSLTCSLISFPILSHDSLDGNTLANSRVSLPLPSYSAEESSVEVVVLCGHGATSF